MSSPRWPGESERRRGSRGVSGSGSTPRCLSHSGDPVRDLECDRRGLPLVRLPAPRLGIIVAVHGVYAFVLKTPEEIMIERELRAAER